MSERSIIRYNIERVPFMIKPVDFFIMPKDKKYAFIFFPEGTGKDIYDLYPTFRFHRRYLRDIFIPNFRFKGMRYFKKFGTKAKFLLSYRMRALIREEEFKKFFERGGSGITNNVIIDFSEILDTIDRFIKGNWRSIIGRNYMKEFFEYYLSLIPDDYEKILIYHVGEFDNFDPHFRLRRFYNLYFNIYGEMNKLPIDKMFVHSYDENRQRYRFRMIMNNGKVPSYSRFFQFYKSIQPKSVDKSKQAENVVYKIKNDLNIELDEEVESTLVDEVKNELSDDSIKKESIDEINEDITEYNINLSLVEKAIESSVIKRINTKIDKNSIKFLKESPIKVDEKKSKNNIDRIKEKLIILNKNKELLIDKNIFRMQRDPNLHTMDENKNQSSSMRKFELSGFSANAKIMDDINLDTFKEESFNTMISSYLKDIINKHGEDDVKLQLNNIRIKETPMSENEFHITAKRTLTIEMEIILHDGRKQKISFEIPKMESGYFILNGSRKMLVSQLLIPPIYFNKPHHCIIQTNFGLMQMDYSIKNKRKTIRCHYAKKSIPLPRVLIFYLGFDKAMDLMFGKGGWSLRNEITPKDKNHIKLLNGYIVFGETLDLIRNIIMESFSPIFWKNVDIDSLKGDNVPDYLGILMEDTRIVNLTQVILNKIIDPVNKKVLQTMEYPTEIENLFIYLIEPLYGGKSEKRNDLNIMRLRNSEILYHIMNKSIEAAYTKYRMQVLSNKKDPVLEVSSNDVLRGFLTHSLVSSAEYNNIIEDVSNKFKVSYTGVESGGLVADAVGLDTRNIDDSFFGVIDPLETSIGGGIGILQHLVPSVGIKDDRGMIETNELNDNNPNIMGTTSSLIPFLNYNETTRAMMASAQLKQSVQLVNGEEPMVRTGHEDVIKKFSSDAYVKRSPIDGTIFKISLNNYINIMGVDKKTYTVPIYPLTLHSGQGLSGYQEFDVTVEVGDNIKKGQVVAQSKYSFGQTSMKYGRNALVAYMYWKGYTFEDGIVISDKLVKDNHFNSPHTFTVEVVISPDECKYISDINVEVGKEYKKSDILLKFIPKNLKSISEYISSADIEQGNILVRPPNGTLYDIEGHLIDTNSPSQELLKFAKKNNFSITNGVKRYYKRDRVFGLLLILRFKTELPINMGDKLSNRHGNKGVVCKIEKEENMPILPSGERIEIILTPLGIAGRNNFGQLLELYMGLVSRTLINMIPGTPKSKFIELVDKLYSLIDKTKEKETKKIILDFLNKLTDQEYKDLPKQMKGFPILVRPFFSPNPYDVKKILGILKLKPGYKLYLPEFNTHTDKEMPVGYLYQSKLEHMSLKKVSGRSTGKTSNIGQPIKTEEASSQRLGELDSFALLSFGSKRLLDEMWTVNSDDMRIKNYVVNSIISRGEVSLTDINLESQDAQVRKMLQAYFISLGLRI